MQSLNELSVGRLLGRYELLMPIAQGGMAAVWAARLRGTRGFQKVVAIKTILPSLSDDPRFEQMFLDEAALASRVRHPNVVQVLDLGEEKGLLYQVMEWIDGEPLSTLVHDSPGGKGIPHVICAKIMIGVCEGLHAAHELKDESGTLVQLVHRDMTPQNILVTVDGVAKVVDFGVAKATTLSSVRTASGQLKGKPAYMAPEQILGGNVDRRADVFSLGVVLYIITTGRHPFRGDNEMATLHRICSELPAAPPRSIIEDYPPELERVVLCALNKDQNKRFKTAEEMAKALHEALPDVVKTGDSEVGAWICGLMSVKFEERRIALKKALLAADERLSQPHMILLSDTPRGGSRRSRDLSATDTLLGLGAPVPALDPDNLPSEAGLIIVNEFDDPQIAPPTLDPATTSSWAPPANPSSPPGRSAPPQARAKSNRAPASSPPEPGTNAVAPIVLSTETKAKKSPAAALLAVAVAIVVVGVGLVLALRPSSPSSNATVQSSAALPTASAQVQTVQPPPDPTASSISVESLPTAADDDPAVRVNSPRSKGKKDKDADEKTPEKASDKAPEVPPEVTASPPVKAPVKASPGANTNVPEIRDPGF